MGLRLGFGVQRSKFDGFGVAKPLLLKLNEAVSERPHLRSLNFSTGGSSTQNPELQAQMGSPGGPSDPGRSRPGAGGETWRKLSFWGL